MTGSTFRSYGIKERVAQGTDLDQTFEKLQLVGFAVVESGYSAEKQNIISEAFNSALETQAELHGGHNVLRRLEEHNTIRAPLLYDDEFVELASNANILALAALVFRGRHCDGAFVLNQQNGIINPGSRENYNQGAFHRDLPYQHFVSSRPLAINALYCVEPFTMENGATIVIPGSHKMEIFPSEAVVHSLSQPVVCQAGSFLVLDCMLYHSGGVNTTSNVRRAVNHVYTLPFIRQQIDLPRSVGAKPDLSSETRRLLGFGNEPPSSPQEFYEGRRRSFSANG